MICQDCQGEIGVADPARQWYSKRGTTQVPGQLVVCDVSWPWRLVREI